MAEADCNLAKEVALRDEGWFLISYPGISVVFSHHAVVAAE